MATVTFHNGVRTQHAWYSGSAAGVIQRWWRAIRDRMVIRKLINIIRGVEGGNVLNSFRRFCPDEAAFLSDRALRNCRLRIRFDGTAFPPKIVYRIYQAGAALYINSGSDWSTKTMLGSARRSQLEIRDSTTNRKEDSWSGGRHNSWRPLLPDDPTASSCNLNLIKFAPQPEPCQLASRNSQCPQQQRRQRPASARVTQNERSRFAAEAKKKSSRAPKWMAAPHLSISRGLQNGWSAAATTEVTLGSLPKNPYAKTKKTPAFDSKLLMPGWKLFPSFEAGPKQKYRNPNLKLDFPGEAVRKFDPRTQQWRALKKEIKA